MRSLATSSRRLRGWLLAVSLIPSAPCAADAPAVAASSPVTSAAAGSYSSAPESFEDSQYAMPTTRDHIGRVTVPVMINGRGPFRFIVDTGASRSTISPRLADTLGLTPANDTSLVVNGITGSAPATFVTVDRLQAGDLSMDALVLPVVWASVMAGADGILGAAGLTEKDLVIDFQRNRVQIAGRVDTLLRDQAVRIHARPPTHGLVTLDARVGRTRVIAIIDTGSERTLGNLALRDALKTTRARGLAKVTSVYGATEEVEPGEIERAPPISIDSLHISDVEIVFGDFHIFDVWGLKGAPTVIIGMDVLGTVASLSIDFKHQDVYVASARSGVRILPMQGVLTDMEQRK